MRAFAIAIALSSLARADLVRGTLKIDVRDRIGRPQEAKVTVHGEGDAEVPEPVRQGRVYVLEGLTQGNWTVEVQGAPPQQITITEGRTTGAVFLLDVGKRYRGFRPFTPQVACESRTGQVIEAVVFARGQLAAGRLDVFHKGRLLCSSVVAGGAASLRLSPGDYQVSADAVGGGRARVRYRVLPNRAPPPLILRTK